MLALMRVAAALILTSTAVLAQVKETVTVSYVEVPVTVTGRDGQPVRGLTAANFELIDDGQKRAVASFDPIDFASFASMSAVSPLNPAARRNFLILFDLTFSTPVARGRAQAAARDFVLRMVERRDRIAVATIDVQRGFRLLTAFTTDRGLIKSAIDDPDRFNSSDPLRIGPSTLDTLRASWIGSSQSDTRGGAVDDLSRYTARTEDLDQRRRVENQIETLTDVARSLRRVSGQKMVVFLSEGFDPTFIQGTENRFTEERVYEMNAIEKGEVWKVDSDARYGSASGVNLLERMSQLFRRSDVVLHALDIKGLRVDNTVEGGLVKKSNEGLFLLANATGGEVFHNNNDLGQNFGKVVEHHQVVYILGFNAPTSQPGKFHSLKVKLVGVPGARVSHRTGYYEAGNDTNVDRALSNAEVVLNDIPQPDIRVHSLAAPFPTTAVKSQVPVILEVSGPDLVKAAKGDATAAEIFIYAFDEEGLVRDSLFERVSLDLTKARERLGEAGVKYYGTLSLPPGKYAVRTLVRVVGTEKRGFARSDVVVPNEDDVSISPPFFVEPAGKWVMVKGGSHDETNAAYPFELNGESFIPTAGVKLEAGAPRKFVIFVYNAEPDELTWELHPDAKLVSQLRSELGAKVMFETVGAAAAAPALTVTVRKKGSTDVRTSTLPLIR